MSATGVLDDRGLPPGTKLRADEISPREFATLLSKGGAILLDVRTLNEWNTARIAGSIHTPLDEFEQRIEQLDLEDAKTIGLLCHHGVRSLKAADVLRAKGITSGRSIIGGIELWSIAVDPNIPRYERNRVTNQCTVLAKGR